VVERSFLVVVADGVVQGEQLSLLDELLPVGGAGDRRVVDL
jgi:hypothetical protein